MKCEKCGHETSTYTQAVELVPKLNNGDIVRLLNAIVKSFPNRFSFGLDFDLEAS